MLTKVEIKNFECFRELEVAPLRRVNLITGRNNTGKTALLEALSMLFAQGPDRSLDLAKVFTTFRFGGNVGVNRDWFFNQNNPKLPVEVVCTLDDKDGFALQIRNSSSSQANPTSVASLPFLGQVPATGLFNQLPCYCFGSGNAGLKAVMFPARQSDPNKNALGFNRVVLNRRKQRLIELLQPLEDRLVGFEMLALHQNAPLLLHAELQGLPVMIPVMQLGQGFTRLLDIFSETLANYAQVLLVDEIENGIHYSVLPIIWKGLFNAAKEANLQIFATTHSWECILAADKAAREGESYDLALIRLDRVEGEVKATVMDEKTLSQAREFDWELR